MDPRQETANRRVDILVVLTIILLCIIAYFLYEYKYGDIRSIIDSYNKNQERLEKIIKIVSAKPLLTKARELVKEDYREEDRGHFREDYSNNVTPLRFEGASKENYGDFASSHEGVYTYL
jgi:hypothetical protein